MKDLRSKATGKKIWVSLDETTDVEQRYVVAFVFGILEEECENSYLANVDVLEKVTHSTVAAFFQKSVKLIRHEEICFESILLVTTDAAPYMVKAMKGLKVLYPRMTHVTCMAHGLHRVAELIRKSYAEVKSFIASTKAKFVKAPLRRQKFKEMAKVYQFLHRRFFTIWFMAGCCKVLCAIFLAHPQYPSML